MHIVDRLEKAVGNLAVHALSCLFFAGVVAPTWRLHSGLIPPKSGSRQMMESSRKMRTILSQLGWSGKTVVP